MLQVLWILQTYKRKFKKFKSGFNGKSVRFLQFCLNSFVHYLPVIQAFHSGQVDHVARAFQGLNRFNTTNIYNVLILFYVVKPTFLIQAVQVALKRIWTDLNFKNSLPGCPDCPGWPGGPLGPFGPTGPGGPEIKMNL